jgi:hypothetical protein
LAAANPLLRAAAFSSSAPRRALIAEKDPVVTQAACGR